MAAESASPGLDSGDGPTEKRGSPRRTRGIRFSDSEWEKVKAAAEPHDVPAAEFVRKRIQDAARGRAGATPPSLTPLIERTFHYAYMPVTHRHDELIRDGRREEMGGTGQGRPETPRPVAGERLRLNAATPRLHPPAHVRRL